MILELPTDLMTIPYNEAVTPEVQPQPSLSFGCNCQAFAYAVLKHFGVELPPFRSSNLWEDDLYTSSVTEFAPLDLMLYNQNERAWGAHVGVFVGEGKIIHLSKAVGRPIVQLHSEVLVIPKYSFFIGAKRVRSAPHFR